MRTKTKIRILKCRNKFIKELTELLKGETGLKEIGDNIHPIEIKLNLIELHYFAKRFEMNPIKEKVYKNVCEIHNSVNLDFGLFHLFSDEYFSTRSFKDESAFEYCLE